ncbi:MAG TPA: AgmX/PglI C-terminal domain-containing protein [Polyangiaceae bacterium]|jgi:hypothetical protein
MKKALFALTLLPVLGCSFHARSPEEYRDATEALLQSKNADVKLCYDDALKTNKEVAGDVTVHFKVEAETGKLFDVTVDAAKTKAPEPLSQCVVKALNGLVLNPPDANLGDATFAYSFIVGPPAPAGG